MSKYNVNGERLGAVLVSLRSETGYTQQEFCDEYSLKFPEENLITKNTVSKWEQGKVIPPPRRLELLAKFYEMEVEDLIRLTDKEGNILDEMSVDEAMMYIAKEELVLFDGQPLYAVTSKEPPASGKFCLVDAKNKLLRFCDGETVAFCDIDFYLRREVCFEFPAIANTLPLSISDIHKLAPTESLWVEPISGDINARSYLRGWAKYYMSTDSAHPQGVIINSSGFIWDIASGYGTTFMVYSTPFVGKRDRVYVNARLERAYSRVEEDKKKLAEENK